MIFSWAASRSASFCLPLTLKASHLFCLLPWSRKRLPTISEAQSVIIHTASERESCRASHQSASFAGLTISLSSTFTAVWIGFSAVPGFTSLLIYSPNSHSRAFFTIKTATKPRNLLLWHKVNLPHEFRTFLVQRLWCFVECSHVVVYGL